MFSSRKILRISLLTLPRNAASFCAIPESLSVAGLSNIVEESYELPNWVKFSEYDNPLMNNASTKDDFVLPKIAEWANSTKLNGDHRKLVRHIAAEIVDSDLNKLSDILKGETFDSVNDVGRVLSVCDGIELTESLVENVLLRFRHDWVPAFGFFNWAKKNNAGYTHSANCYNTMVDILGMSYNFDLTWDLIEEMDKIGGGLVTSLTLSLAIRRLAKCGKHDEAVEAFENKFEKYGVIRQTEEMNMLLGALVKERYVERAQKAYLDLKDKIKPNYITFNTLIHGWTKAKNYTEAKQAISDMEKHGIQPDVYSYTCFISYYCHLKDFRKVDLILDEMKQKGCSPNVVTYTIIMRSLGGAKQTNEALEICRSMKLNGCDPDSSFYSALINILIKPGRFKDACEIFKDVPDGVRDVLIYNTMISVACNQSKEEYAIELLKEMEGKSSLRPTLKTYTPLLKMCCEKKRIKVLNYLLADMFRKGVSLDLSVYCLLVDRLCKSRKLEHACSFFERMVLKGMVPRDKTYALLMEKLEEKGMGKAKQQIGELMLKAKNNLGALKKEVEKVPPPLGNKVRKHTRKRTTPQAYLSSPKGVISSLAGISSPPRKNVANSPHARQITLPLRPPMPSNNDVANESNVAVLLPNIACAILPPSSLPHGNKFSEVTTIPKSPAKARGSTGTPTPSTALGNTLPSSSA